MTQKGFEDYLFAIYGFKNGTAKSYITAIHIIDNMLAYEDVFGLDGKSITTLDDFDLLKRIEAFIIAQQSLFKRGEDSIFRNIKENQRSYPAKNFVLLASNNL